LHGGIYLITICLVKGGEAIGVCHAYCSKPNYQAETESRHGGSDRPWLATSKRNNLSSDREEALQATKKLQKRRNRAIETHQAIRAKTTPAFRSLMDAGQS
jgi:hypothetical protein